MQPPSKITQQGGHDGRIPLPPQLQPQQKKARNLREDEGVDAAQLLLQPPFPEEEKYHPYFEHTTDSTTLVHPLPKVAKSSVITLFCLRQLDAFFKAVETKLNKICQLKRKSLSAQSQKVCDIAKQLLHELKDVYPGYEIREGVWTTTSIPKDEQIRRIPRWEALLKKLSRERLQAAITAVTSPPTQDRVIRYECDPKPSAKARRIARIYQQVMMAAKQLDTLRSKGGIQ